MTRPAPVPDRYLNVVRAALTGGEDDVRISLSTLSPSELSRLRNALRAVADLAEDRRKHLWRQR